jgi:hypothetical protein
VEPSWSGDARFSAWHNALHAVGGLAADESGDLKGVLEDIAQGPYLLDEPATEDRLSREIGRMVVSHMSYPDDLGLAELVEIAIEPLMTIEIRNWLRRHLGLDISLVEIGNPGTVGEVSRTTLRIMRKKHQAGELTRDKAGQLGRGEVVQMGLQEADEHRLGLEDQALACDFRPIDPMITLLVL